MTDRFEDDLRAALRPLDPGADFAERVLARLPAQAPDSAADIITPGATKVVPMRSRRVALRWLPLALAATLVAAVLIRHEWQLNRELERGRVAREQLLEALRVTSEKLDVVYRAAQSQPAIELKDDSQPESDKTTI